MYSNESASDQSPSYEALGAGSGYVLTEEQKAALAVTDKIALAVVSEALRRSFSQPNQMTEALMEITQLDRDTLVAGNKELRREEHIKLEVGVESPGEIRLHLTEKGKRALDEHLAHLLSSAT